MKQVKISAAHILDAIALALFLACWVGYAHIVQRVDERRPHLLSVVRSFRKRWIERLCERENHVADAALISNLLRGALFFASTTIFILGGLAALLGTAPKAAELVSQLPYTAPMAPWLAEAKILILMLVYVYAFFKFTWSAWQYNVLSIMVGAMPRPTATYDHGDYAEAAASVLALAGETYNNGIRSYYFSIPLMAWFVDPLLFLAATLTITVILYRREFSSPMLQALQKVRIESSGRH